MLFTCCVFLNLARKCACVSKLKHCVCSTTFDHAKYLSFVKQGANLQLRGRLRMKDFDRRVIPTSGLDKVIVTDELMKSLQEIVQFEKAR